MLDKSIYSTNCMYSLVTPVKHALKRLADAARYTWDSRDEIWRVFRGAFSLATPIVFLAVILLFIGLLSERFDRDSTWGEFWEGVFTFGSYLLIAILLAVLIVYLLRSLHWLRTRGREFWNEETAPPVQGPSHGPGRPRVNRPLSEAKYQFLHWSALAVMLWLAFATSLLITGLVTQFLGQELPGTDLVPQDTIFEFILQLPIIGELLGFGYYPGDGLIGNISYFVAAIPLAIAIRNLVYVFEHIHDFDTTEDESLLRNIALTCGVVLVAILIVILLVAALFAIALILD